MGGVQGCGFQVGEGWDGVASVCVGVCVCGFFYPCLELKCHYSVCTTTPSLIC